MRRIAIVAPGWLGETEEDSVLVRPGDRLESLAKTARVSVLGLPDEEALAPDSALLGLEPSLYPMAPGPLAVACFGVKPPLGSTAFHLILCSTDGEATTPVQGLSDEEAGALIDAARVLETSALRLILGEGLDHALASQDEVPELQPAWPSFVYANPFSASLGTLTRPLRRFVDDSVNVLMDTELNRRREDQGLPPANVLWPWGPGPVRARLPWTEEGVAPTLASPSIRLHGFAAVSKMPRLPRGPFRSHDFPFHWLAENAFGADQMLIHFPDIQRARRAGDLDRVRWLSKALATELIGPIMDQARKIPTELALIATNSVRGMISISNSEKPNGNGQPFDERALEAPSAGLMHQAIRDFFLQDPPQAGQ